MELLFLRDDDRGSDFSTALAAGFGVSVGFSSSSVLTSSGSTFSSLSKELRV